MDKTDNLHEYLTDIADAIREVKGTTEPINAQDFSDEIRGMSTSQWTGHVDVDGLRSIGWDDEDIAYYQRYGVNWNEEDDQYHLVSDDNKALYGVLTADNIQEYKDRIVYLPKIDFGGVTTMTNKFNACAKLVALPQIQTSNVLYFDSAFENCYSLVCLPVLDFKEAYSAKSMFRYCYSLQYVPAINSSELVNIDYMFQYCRSLVHAPAINFNEKTSGRGDSMFNSCSSLSIVPPFRDFGIKTNAFRYTYVLTTLRIDGIINGLHLNETINISKGSILYMIEHEAAASPITITLHAIAYARLSTDPDIVEALSNHPSVSLASA